MGRNTLTKVTIVNFLPPKKNTLGQFVLQNYGALCFVMDMLTQLCILTKLKKIFL